MVLVWKVKPILKGKEVLERFIEVHMDGDCLITPFEEKYAAQWSKALIDEGVSIFEMNRKVPVLEDLFLQLTGSDPSDQTNSK